MFIWKKLVKTVFGYIEIEKQVTTVKKLLQRWHKNNRNLIV